MTTANEMAGLAADFPDWHVWRARSGSGILTDWHATASRRLRLPGTLGRLAAPDAPSLRALLGHQQALRRGATA
jgi:hypothetical protein